VRVGYLRLNALRLWIVEACLKYLAINRRWLSPSRITLASTTALHVSTRRSRDTHCPCSSATRRQVPPPIAHAVQKGAVHLQIRSVPATSGLLLIIPRPCHRYGSGGAATSSAASHPPLFSSVWRGGGSSSRTSHAVLLPRPCELTGPQSKRGSLNSDRGRLQESLRRWTHVHW
jgi:hypothetical protein